MTYFKKEGADGEPPEIITDLKAMDQMLRDNWGAIYKGNCDDNQQLVKRFYDKYKNYIYEHEEVKVPDMSTEDVWESFTRAKASSAGID